MAAKRTARKKSRSASSRKPAAKKPAKKTTARKTPARKTTKKTSRAAPLTYEQKNLKERQKTPWHRIRALKMDDPRIYSVPWDEKDILRKYPKKYLPGIGYLFEGEQKGIEEYEEKPYTWLSYCLAKARREPDTPCPEGENAEVYTLRDDQEEDKETVLTAWEAKAPEFLIANGTGMGKTVTAWSTIQEMNPRNVLIVCPAPVIAVWRQHVLDMGDHGIDVAIINYESLKKLIAPPDSAVAAKKTSTQNKNIALHGTPYESFDIVVFDEAHKLKNPISQQSRIAYKLATTSDFIMRLTATPGKDPANLHHLWRGLSWATDSSVEVSDDSGFDDYRIWCAQHGIEGLKTASFGNGLAWSGARKDLVNMHDIMYTSSHGKPLWAIKRKHADDFVTRQPLPLEISQQEKEAYQGSLDTVRRSILAIDKGSAKQVQRQQVRHALAELILLRQKTGLLKASKIMDFVEYCLNDLGEQLVLSTAFYNTSDLLAELLAEKKIGYTILNGSLSADEKEANRVSFQRGEVPVIISSITTGVSLHAREAASGASDAPRRLIVVDTQWSPIEHTQLEGRINRNQEHGVVTIPYLQGTVDRKVVSALISGLTTQSVIQNSGEENDLHFLAGALGISL